MPRVPLRYLVSFSSEDPRHKAENMLTEDVSKKWLSAADDRSGQLEGVFQLDKACTISNIDIGTFCTFSVQISVGRSCWPASREYCTLVPTTTFMTPMDCRSAKNSSSLRMFNKGHFSCDTALLKWDRIKVVCSQPFRKDLQHGLSMLSIHSDDTIGETPLPVFNDEEATADTDKPSSTDIQKHFFGKEIVSSAQKQSAELQSSLAQIGATKEGGSVQESKLSRNTKLVLAAASITGTPKYKAAKEADSPKIDKSPKTHGSASKLRIPFDKEVANFLSSISVAEFDLENFTFADLRHKLEKQKIRKLSKDEKKIFFKMAQDHFEAIFSKTNESEKSPTTNTSAKSPLGETKSDQTANNSKAPVSKKQVLMQKMQKNLARRQSLTEVDPNSPQVSAQKVDPTGESSKSKKSSTFQSPKTTAEKPSKSSSSPVNGTPRSKSSSVEQTSVKINHAEQNKNEFSKELTRLGQDRVPDDGQPVHSTSDRPVLNIPEINGKVLNNTDCATSSSSVPAIDSNLQNGRKQTTDVCTKNTSENLTKCVTSGKSGKTKKKTKTCPALHSISLLDSSSDESTQKTESSMTTKTSVEQTLESNLEASSSQKRNTGKRKSDSSANFEPSRKKKRISKTQMQDSTTNNSGLKNGNKKVKKCSKLHTLNFDSGSDNDDGPVDTNNMWLSKNSVKSSGGIRKKCSSTKTNTNISKTTDVWQPSFNAVSDNSNMQPCFMDIPYASTPLKSSTVSCAPKEIDYDPTPQKLSTAVTESGSCPAQQKSSTTRYAPKEINYKLNLEKSSTVIKENDNASTWENNFMVGYTPKETSYASSTLSCASKGINETQTSQKSSTDFDGGLLWQKSSTNSYASSDIGYALPKNDYARSDVSYNRSRRKMNSGPTHTVTSASLREDQSAAQDMKPTVDELDPALVEDIQYDVSQNFVQCPLCNCMYAKQSIETHAARCQIDITNDSDTDCEAVNDMICGAVHGEDNEPATGECPICGEVYTLEFLARHASTCGTLPDEQHGSNVMANINTCMYAEQDFDHAHAAHCHHDLTDDSETDDDSVDEMISAAVHVGGGQVVTQGDCPICGDTYAIAFLANHIDICASLREEESSTPSPDAPNS